MLRSLVTYENPHSLGSYLRRRRQKLLKRLIDHRFEKKQAPIQILDIGGRRYYWELLSAEYLAARDVHITIVNLPSEANLDENSERITITTGNGCDLNEYADSSFDIVHSNSTIEHLGSWENMQRFAHEVRRLAPSYFIQTPYYWFPIEPHYVAPFVHWIPESWRAQLLTRMTLGNYPRANSFEDAMVMVKDAHLLNIAQMKRLFPDARMHYEYLGPLPPKSLIAVKWAE